MSQDTSTWLVSFGGHLLLRRAFVLALKTRKPKQTTEHNKPEMQSSNARQGIVVGRLPLETGLLQSEETSWPVANGMPHTNEACHCLQEVM